MNNKNNQNALNGETSNGEGRPSLKQQIFRFAIVGGLSFVIDFAIYTAIILFLGNGRMVVAFAACMGFVISLIFNYLTSMKFVFVRKDGVDRKKEFAVFAILSVIGLILNEVIILGMLSMFDKISDDAPGLIALFLSFKEWISKIFATGIVMVYNFVTRKIFLEKH